MNFVATFHTHLSALRSQKQLGAQNIPARLAPVPRALSSSCGTCILYEGTEPMIEAMDRDLEAVYQKEGDGYHLIFETKD